MNLSTKKLESLFQRAINPDFDEMDITALDCFCEAIQLESHLSNTATKIIANKIQSNSIKESLNALSVLEECMSKCGVEFQSEIGKFRFLNELIKLVSKKYRGNITPKIIRDKILDLLLIWTVQYPIETKIKEAYDMLRTQGVIHEPAQSITVDHQIQKNITPVTASINSCIKQQPQEDEKSKRLRKLLQSKNPLDVHAANLLIQNMVKEDEKKSNQKSLRLLELQKVRANVSILNEMLDQYKPGETSEDELHTINELLATCENLHPTVLRLAQETQENEETLEDILEASDNLSRIFEKYKTIVLENRLNYNIKKQQKPQQQIKSNVEILSSLLDFTNARTTTTTLSSGITTTTATSSISPTTSSSSSSSTSTMINNTNNNDLMETITSIDVDDFIQNNKNNDINELKTKDIILNDLLTNIDHINIESPFGNMMMINNEILKPQIAPSIIIEQASSAVESTPILMPVNSKVGNSSIFNDKLLLKQGNNSISKIPDLDLLVNGILQSSLNENKEKINSSAGSIKNTEDEEILNGDDKIEILTTTTTVIKDQIDEKNSSETMNVKNEIIIETKPEIRSLAEIEIDLDKIKPSQEPPRIIMNDPDGLKIVLNFAKDHPRPDVFIIVVSTINQGVDPITNFQFDASASKHCKLRLLEPSSTTLPGIKPFRPPADITQVLLYANQKNIESINMVCILSYCIGDDPDPVRESIEVKNLPNLLN